MISIFAYMVVIIPEIMIKLTFYFLMRLWVFVIVAIGSFTVLRLVMGNIIALAIALLMAIQLSTQRYNILGEL